MKGTFCITSLRNLRKTTNNWHRSRVESFNATGVLITPRNAQAATLRSLFVTNLCNDGCGNIDVCSHIVNKYYVMFRLQIHIKWQNTSFLYMQVAWTQPYKTGSQKQYTRVYRCFTNKMYKIKQLTVYYSGLSHHYAARIHVLNTAYWTKLCFHQVKCMKF